MRARRRVARSGSLNLTQARVIVEAMDALPTGLEPALRMKAEVHLVEQAASFGPRHLARLGQRVLEVVAPEIAEEADGERLLAEERRNRKATRMFFRPRGDGSTDVNARVPDQVANRLRAYLDGYASPRNKRLGEVDALPLSPLRGEAFCALLENLGRAGVAVTSTGDRISADEARRMACRAGIIPFVMSGRSVILDQGRRKRLFDHHQRAALHLRFQECTEVDCSIPAAWTEAHHKLPWARGGRTDPDDGTLLCPFHHHRAHDPGWITRHHPNGSTTFTRRQ